MEKRDDALIFVPRRGDWGKVGYPGQNGPPSKIVLIIFKEFENSKKLHKKYGPSSNFYLQ